MPLLLREPEFKELFTQDLPLIDVRAPLEFALLPDCQVPAA